MIRLPVGIAPPFGNCFLAVLLNDPIPRKDMADLCKYVSFDRKIHMLKTQSIELFFTI